MRSAPAHRERHAFTLIELLVVIAIISLLVSILLPSLTRARELATALQCQVKLRNLGVAMGMYHGDYDGNYNHTVKSEPINVALNSYQPSILSPSKNWIPSQAWACESSIDPASGAYYGRPYGMNTGFTMGRLSTSVWDGNWGGLLGRVNAADLRAPTENLFMMDAYTVWYSPASGGAPFWYWRTWTIGDMWGQPGTGSAHPEYRHHDKANAVLADGHCDSFSVADLNDRAKWMVRD